MAHRPFFVHVTDLHLRPELHQLLADAGRFR